MPSCLAAQNWVLCWFLPASLFRPGATLIFARLGLRWRLLSFETINTTPASDQNGFSKIRFPRLISGTLVSASRCSLFITSLASASAVGMALRAPNTSISITIILVSFFIFFPPRP